MTESFNSWIGELRGKPILTLIELLVVKLMGKIHRRNEEGHTWQHTITQKIKKKIDKIKWAARYCSITAAGDMEFQVNNKDGILWLI